MAPARPRDYDAVGQNAHYDMIWHGIYSMFDDPEPPLGWVHDLYDASMRVCNLIHVYRTRAIAHLGNDSAHPCA